MIFLDCYTNWSSISF